MEATIDSTTIPFGFRESDQKFVDVAHVARGKECGCVCPSCKTPLIAKKGNIKEWHFAHEGRSSYERAETICDFSFYVSARLMALQIIGGQIDILLPEYLDKGKLKTTEAKKLTLSDVKVEQKFSGVMVDVMGRVRDYVFILYFTHPGRAFPDALSEPKDRRCGIVSIALDALPNLFGIVGVKQSYKDRLSDFIVNDIASKKWRYHPRYARCTKHDADQIKDGNTTAQPLTVKSVAQRLANLECVFCKVRWQDLYPGPISCPKCHDHLGCRLICYAEKM